MSAIITISWHARERMRERNVSESLVHGALKGKGRPDAGNVLVYQRGGVRVVATKPNTRGDQEVVTVIKV